MPHGATPAPPPLPNRTEGRGAKGERAQGRACSTRAWTASSSQRSRHQLESAPAAATRRRSCAALGDAPPPPPPPAASPPGIGAPQYAHFGVACCSQVWPEWYGWARKAPQKVLWQAGQRKRCGSSSAPPPPPPTLRAGSSSISAVQPSQGHLRRGGRGEAGDVAGLVEPGMRVPRCPPPGVLHPAGGTHATASPDGVCPSTNPPLTV
jgi:hypothetical protein